jgi:hypothetical protein
MGFQRLEPYSMSEQDMKDSCDGFATERNRIMYNCRRRNEFCSQSDDDGVNYVCGSTACEVATAGGNNVAEDGRVDL